MHLISSPHLTENIKEKLNILIDHCDGYEPFYNEDDSLCESVYHYILYYKQDQSELIGFLSSLQLSNDRFEISALVDPSYRRHGIFNTMLKALKEALQENETTLQGNKTLQKTDINLICPLPDSLIASKCNKGLCYTEYLMQLSNVRMSNLLISDSQDFEFYFTDDNEHYLMYANDSFIKQYDIASIDYEEPIAVCSLDEQHSFTNIYEVYVEPDLRGKGIGSCFMNHFIYDYLTDGSETTAINLKDSEGIISLEKPLILQVNSENTAAFQLYKKCGFIEQSHIDYYLI